MFEFFNPVRIHFGVDFKEALKFIAQNESEILLVSTKGWALREPKIKQILKPKIIINEISPNPKLQDLQNLAKNLGEFNAVVAFGGGSVMDSAKFFIYEKMRNLAGNFQLNLTKNSSQKSAQNFTKNKPNFYAFPTTFGTSSELSKWATIWDFERVLKLSINDEILYANHAFYDVNLSLNLAKKTTIFTALDALSHAFESVWNTNANPISTHFATKAIEIILRDLPNLSKNLSDFKLRSNIALSSIYAGLAFSNTQTALAHAISYPLTLKFGTPHGLACSFSLPLLLKNLPPKSAASAILSPFERNLNALFEKLNISTKPSDYGLNEAFIDEIFTSLNERAKNAIFDAELIKEKFKLNLN